MRVGRWRARAVVVVVVEGVVTGLVEVVGGIVNIYMVMAVNGIQMSFVVVVVVVVRDGINRE